MSKNPSSAAIARDHAAVEASSPRAVAVPKQDLADLAAMLARVEALVAADVTPEPTGSGSIERIADIAFVLHERDVEASLCDALDAAVREISATGEQKEDRARRARQAAEVLRELAQRIKDMMALSGAQHSESPGTANRIEEHSPQAVAPRGASPPSPAPAVAPVSNPQRETSDPQRETDAVAASPSAPIQKTKSLGGQEAIAAAQRAVPPRPAVAAMLAAEPPSGAFLDDDLLLPTTANEAAISNKPALNAVSSSAAPSSSPNSPAAGKATPLLNPEDDPGDLFEPEAGTPLPEPAAEIAVPTAMLKNGVAPVPRRVADVAACTVQSDNNAVVPPEAAAVSLGADSPVASSNPPRPLRFTTATVAPSAPSPEPADPLAPIRALSAEEMIALFS